MIFAAFNQTMLVQQKNGGKCGELFGYLASWEGPPTAGKAWRTQSLGVSSQCPINRQGHDDLAAT